MSLLPRLATDTNVTLPAAGGFISAYAVGVVVGSPIIAMIGANCPRRTLLVAILALVAAGYLLSSLAWDRVSLIAARFVAGLPHGAFYGVASLTATAMVPATKRASALGYVMLGLAAANLAGVPVATWIGDHYGWRAVFGVIAAGAAVTGMLVILAIPLMKPVEPLSALQQLSAFTRPHVWLTLLTASVGFGGMFAVYTFITPTLTNVSHFSQSSVPSILALWGLGMVVGNIIGGKLADKALVPSIFGLLAWNALFLGLLTFVSDSKWQTLIVLFLVGNGFALVPALQARLMTVAGKAQTLASSLNHSAFNTSNALGAALGGMAVSSRFGLASTGVVGASLAVAGAIPMLISVMAMRKK